MREGLGTGERRAYASELAGLWSGLSATLARLEPVRVLARVVERVLEMPERLEDVVVGELLGLARDLLELGEGACEPTPKLAHLARVPLSGAGPRRQEAHPSARGSTTIAARMQDPRPLVLVVDDDPSLRLLVRVNLELEGFRVQDAVSQDEARAAVAAERPTLVMLDMHLFGEPADELLDEFRAAGIPVVLVTGTADVDDYRDRANAVLGKPFQPQALIAAARQLAAVG